MKMNFDISKYKNECYKQLERKKVDEKNGFFCLVSMFPSQVMVLKLSEKVHFLQFCADLSKKTKSVNRKVLITLFQKMIWFIGV